MAMDRERKIGLKELRYCTCELCGLPALGERTMRRPDLLPRSCLKMRYVIVRVNNRPRCSACVKIARDE